MLIISINSLQNYQLTTSTSAYVLLCLCVSENQPLVITAANHLDTACSSLLDRCKQCRDEAVKIGQGTAALNCFCVMSHKDQELNKMITINTIASICHENMLAYLSADIIFSDRQTIFQQEF